MQNETDADFQQSAAHIRSSFQRLFETIMEQIADRIYIKDTKGRFVFVSDALARAHGHTHRSDLEGMSDFDFYDKEIADSFYAEEVQILDTNTPVVNRVEKEVWLAQVSYDYHLWRINKVGRAPRHYKIDFIS